MKDLRANSARALLVVLALVCAVGAAEAQDQAPTATAAAADAAALAEKLSNPVSDLVSVPFQFNWAQGVGQDNQTRFILNVQPVMPFTLSKDWNLITRVIMPMIGQPVLAAGGSPSSGLGDVLGSFFFSPSRSGKVTVGVGPAISLPSTNEPTLGSGKWSAGPTFVALTQRGPWTVGVLWNQVFSFAGDPARKDVNQMFLQPFLTYTTKSLWTMGVNSEAIANWKADTDKWTVPINFSVAKLSSFGPFPASYQVGFGVYVASPAGGPTWQLRTAMVILLPRKK